MGLMCLNGCVLWIMYLMVYVGVILLVFVCVFCILILVWSSLSGCFIDEEFLLCNCFI